MMHSKNQTFSAAEALVLSYVPFIGSDEGAQNKAPEGRTGYTRDKYPSIGKGKEKTQASESDKPPTVGGLVPRRASKVQPQTTIDLDSEVQPPEVVLPPKNLSRSERQHRARRLSNCPRSISFCGRSAISRGVVDLTSSQSAAGVEGEERGLAMCGHRSCPVCGPLQQSEKAELLSKALLVLAAEGWRVGMVTLTFPHHLATPTDALANALAAGISAASKVLNSYANAAAIAARSALARMDRNHRGEPAQRASLLETIRDNSLLWLAPSPEVTLGSHGLHPHYHVLVLVPPSLQKQSWFKGRKVDKYWRLFELEDALWEAWTPAVIGALRAGVRRDLQELYRPSDWTLGVEAVERQQRVDELARSGAPGLDAARAELRQATLAARPDSCERRELRGRMVQAVRWSGAVAAAAHYTWGASNEISGAGKINTLWRTLDHDSTAPLWGLSLIHI